MSPVLPQLHGSELPVAASFLLLLSPPALEEGRQRLRVWLQNLEIWIWGEVLRVPAFTPLFPTLLPLRRYKFKNPPNHNQSWLLFLVIWMLRYKMMPMQKIRIFWRDPDATDSSSDEDGQKPKKEKTITREMPVPVKKRKTSKPLKTIMPCGTKYVKGPERKVPSGGYRGVPQRGLGRWQAEIHNPLTKGQEYSSHNAEDAAGVAYQAKQNQCRAEMLAMKAQPSVSEHVAFSNSSLASSVYSSVSSEQKVQEAQKRVGLLVEIHHEPLDESLLTPTPREISEGATLDWKCELPDIDSVSLAAKLPHDDLTRPEDMFPVSDFISADTTKPPDDDYIGLADISHLHPPFKDPEFDWDSELDWSWFDFASLEHELGLL